MIKIKIDLNINNSRIWIKKRIGYELQLIFIDILYRLAINFLCFVQSKHYNMVYNKKSVKYI